MATTTIRYVTCNLKSKSPYSQSRAYQYDDEWAKHKGESSDDYEKRTWRGRLHTDEGGHVTIPLMTFKVALSEAAKYNPIQIQGKGKSTYTKHFEAGVLVDVEGSKLTLPIKAEAVPGDWLFVPSNGERGGGKRVRRCFPRIDKWSASPAFVVTDPVITKEVFEETLTCAGDFIGVGRFRPRNNGYFGRFEVVSCKWSTL